MKIKQGVVKIVWLDGNWKWYRISNRYLKDVANGFFNIPNFHYGKVYDFNRNTRKTGRQIGHFGVNKETGELYINKD
ncbi:MAG: hypothetical protein CMP48_25140 [Rickettsiales bacterium]|nr:hypothetical protein [Rickettsiales bacterium]